MSNRRLIRVAEVLRNELTRLITRERRLEGFILTVTDVEVTPDIKQAFIYISVMNTEVPETQILQTLESLRAGWQKQIGSKMRTKYTPRLTFRMDTSQKRGDRVIQILDSLQPPENSEE